MVPGARSAPRVHMPLACHWQREEVARKLLGPKPFKATTMGKQFKKVCREAFDRERE